MIARSAATVCVLQLMAILMVGCGESSAKKPATPKAPKQGVRCRVVKMVGDFTMEPPTGRLVPMRVPVHVFRGRIKPFEQPDLKHPALIKVLQSGKDGRCELALPPGEYTLVADIDNELYLNNQMEDGNWAIVVVRAGEWSDYVIENVLEATF